MTSTYFRYDLCSLQYGNGDDDDDDESVTYDLSNVEYHSEGSQEHNPWENLYELSNALQQSVTPEAEEEEMGVVR